MTAQNPYAFAIFSIFCAADLTGLMIVNEYLLYCVLTKFTTKQTKDPLAELSA